MLSQYFGTKLPLLMGRSILLYYYVCGICYFDTFVVITVTIYRTQRRQLMRYPVAQLLVYTIVGN